MSIATNKGRKLLEAFSFTLQGDEHVALIGEEGNGKSTLLKILAGIDVSDYVSYEGSISAEGRIGYLPQSLSEPERQLTALAYLAAEPDYSRLYPLLGRLDIDAELLDQKIATLSGGERVRIMLLKVLYDDPDILLLDEPSNDLDLQTMIWLEEFIRNSSLPMIFISHDETLLNNCSEGILHLEQLKRKSEPHITYAGTSYEEYQRQRQAFIARNNMIAAKERSEYKAQLDKWRQIYQKVEHAQNTISRQDPHGAQLLKKKMHAVKAQGHNLEKQKEDLRQTYEPEEAIDIFFDEVSLDPHKQIIDLQIPRLEAGDQLLAENIELHLSGKDKICIIGPNGSGKSTLLKLIAKQLLDRDDISCGYMPQNYQEVMDYELTPLEFLWDGSRKADKDRIGNYLGALRFTSEEMSHKIADLSEGQKCKILFVKLILDHNDVLLLDEPTRNLSPLSGPKIREILADFRGCMIAVSHDRRFIEELDLRLFELCEGQLKELF